jgi:hypothetical protein
LDQGVILQCRGIILKRLSLEDAERCCNHNFIWTKDVSLKYRRCYLASFVGVNRYGSELMSVGNNIEPTCRGGRRCFFFQPTQHSSDHIPRRYRILCSK